jgi:hypothetical protein
MSNEKSVAEKEPDAHRLLWSIITFSSFCTHFLYDTEQELVKDSCLIDLKRMRILKILTVKSPKLQEVIPLANPMQTENAKNRPMLKARLKMQKQYGI